MGGVAITQAWDRGDRYLLTCYRYIELNPVRANIAEGPDDYRWSSYPCNALGKGAARRLSVACGRTRFATGGVLKGLRQATQTNRVFGADYFQKQVEAALAVRIAKRKPGPRGKESPG